MPRIHRPGRPDARVPVVDSGDRLTPRGCGRLLVHPVTTVAATRWQDCRGRRLSAAYLGITHAAPEPLTCRGLSWKLAAATVRGRRSAALVLHLRVLDRAPARRQIEES